MMTPRRNVLSCLLASAMAVLVSGCGGGGHAPLAVPGINGSASTHRVGMTATVARQAKTASENTNRRILTIPSNANSVEVDAYVGTLPLPASGARFTPPSGSTPASTACADFPTGQTQTTVTIQVPVGAATIVISSNSGACSGNIAQGTVLSQASGTGTATAIGGDLGNAFFGSTNGVNLSLISNSDHSSNGMTSPGGSPLITITDNTPGESVVLSEVDLSQENVENDVYCLPYPSTAALVVKDLTVAIAPVPPVSYQAKVGTLDHVYPETGNGTVNGLGPYGSLGFTFSRDFDKDRYPQALYRIVGSGRHPGSFPDFLRINRTYDVTPIDQLFPVSKTSYVASATILDSGGSCTRGVALSRPQLQITDLSRSGNPVVSGTTQNAQVNTTMDLQVSAVGNTVPAGYTLKNAIWTILGNPVLPHSATPLSISALTQSEVKFAWTQPGTNLISVSAVYVNASGTKITTNPVYATYKIADVCLSGPQPTPAFGDMIVYSDPEGGIVHVGVVTETRGSCVLKIRSKWGTASAIYDSSPDLNPYSPDIYKTTWSVWHRRNQNALCFFSAPQGCTALEYVGRVEYYFEMSPVYGFVTDTHKVKIFGNVARAVSQNPYLAPRYPDPKYPNLEGVRIEGYSDADLIGWDCRGFLFGGILPNVNHMLIFQTNSEGQDQVTNVLKDDYTFVTVVKPPKM